MENINQQLRDINIVHVSPTDPVTQQKKIVNKKQEQTSSGKS